MSLSVTEKLPDLSGGVVTSWFTEEVICIPCSDREAMIRETMRRAGTDPLLYEGIGYIPPQFQI